MRASESGGELVLQPENDGEETALTRLREIYRRATRYRLPAPYWDAPTRYFDVRDGGKDVLVFIDGMGWTSDDADGEATGAARVDDAPYRQPIRFDPTGSDIAKGTS